MWRKPGEKAEKKLEEGEWQEPSTAPIGLLELFKFASSLDYFLVVFGVVLALCGGAGGPILMVMFGVIIQSFTLNDYQVDLGIGKGSGNWTKVQLAEAEVMEAVTWFGYSTIGLSLGLWLVSAISVTCLNIAAARQVFRIRGEFLRVVLKQDISWYDTSTTTDFASKMTEDLNKVQEGIGEKLGMLTFYGGSLFISISIAFTYSWDVTLVILSLMPFTAIFGGIAAKVQTSFAEKEMKAYGRAGAVAEEVLAAVRTVVAFGGQDKEVATYSKLVEGAQSRGVQRGLLTGLTGGLSFGVMCAMYGLAFWYGIKCIVDDREGEVCQLCQPDDIACIQHCQRLTAGDLLTVFLCVLLGGFRAASAAPYLEALTTARSAAAKIFRIIERVPSIDSSSESGKKPEKMTGAISFKDVVFSYPSRAGVPILKDFSLEIPSGQTVALVGSSGSGKSTVVQLLQRFYDPVSGGVEVDGINVKELNIGWLRRRIGVVGQEPVLFDLTIRENIRLGNQAASNEDIERACKAANAFNFIQKLPNGLDTNVGEGGSQLSGGQKQRIAIARALLRQPRILLLDEATSALDTESEKVVQEALERASRGRTTVVVAHRLSTIRSADLIVAMKGGKVEEMGSHTELMEMKGLYYSLVVSQLENNDDAPTKSFERPSIYNDCSEAPFEIEQGDLDMVTFPTSETARPPKNFKDEESANVSISRLLQKNKPEAGYIFIGCLASICVASMMPILAILFGKVLSILGDLDTTQARSDSIFYAFMFLGLGVLAALSQLVQGWMFAISGEALTTRLRTEMYQAMLAQEIGWHDLEENNTGALCARLSGDAGKVQGATGSRLGSVLHATFAMLIGVAVGVYYEWRLGLLGAALFPIMVASTVINQKIVNGVDSKERDAFEKSAKLAVEAITNIRTVAGLQCESKYVEIYIKLLSEPHKANMKNCYLRGILFGFTQGLQYIMWAVLMWYGGYLVEIGAMHYSLIFTVAEATLSGAWIMGNAFAFSGDFNRALNAANRVFQLLDRKPRINANRSEGLKLDHVDGNIELRNADFWYPSRPNLQILNGLNLSVKAGDRIALVGESGCGKSTVLQLIQRLYDLDQGSLSVQGHKIESLNVPQLRSRLGLVSQEPVLFNRSIKENIEYGDNEREVSMEEVVAAARMANIHQFVSALPEGYDTPVGNRGSQLSGGQKQRVAIARMLLRNPRILLLDEATSALDAESEKVVQEALERAQQGRTSITIAHRLSTIKNSDQIYVVQKGRIVEHGTHDQLINMRANYFKLWKSNTSMDGLRGL